MPIKSLMISKSGKWFVKPFLNELELAPDQQKMGNEKLVSYNRNYFFKFVPVGFYIPIGLLIVPIHDTFSKSDFQSKLSMEKTKI